MAGVVPCMGILHVFCLRSSKTLRISQEMFSVWQWVVDGWVLRYLNDENWSLERPSMASCDFQRWVGNLLKRSWRLIWSTDDHAHIIELPWIPPKNAGLEGLPASEHIEVPRGWCENGLWETCSRPWSVRSSRPQVFWLLFEGGGSPATETSTCGT